MLRGVARIFITIRGPQAHWDSKEFGTPPFPFPPPGANRGGAGSPHAAKSGRLPPQEGFQNAPLKPPLWIPPPLAGGMHPNGVYGIQ